MKRFNNKAFYNRVLTKINNKIYKDNNKSYVFNSYIYSKGVYNLYFKCLDNNKYKVIVLYHQYINDYINTIDLINKCF